MDMRKRIIGTSFWESKLRLGTKLLPRIIETRDDLRRIVQHKENAHKTVGLKLDRKGSDLDKPKHSTVRGVSESADTAEY